MSSRSSIFWSLGACAWIALSLSCMERGDRVDRTQTNLVPKSAFDGEWWFTHTAIDVEDDAAWAIGMAGAQAPWPGATASFDIASSSGVVGRIRWVIDEGFLYAFRSTEIVSGASRDVDDPEYRGQPLAVYRILAHVDVRQEYNPSTGEPTNVISESNDRQWYDRQYMRVDWSTNLVTWGLFGGSLEIEELFGTYRREPVPLGIVDGGNTDLPPEWAPQFVRLRDEVGCTPAREDEQSPERCYRYFDEWPSDQRETVHYMSFVTQEVWTPLQCADSTCATSVAITMRDAFLRIPPNHEYAVETLSNSEYDRFGIIRTESRTYLRGGEDRSTLGRYCQADADCDPACAGNPPPAECEVLCDTEQNVCVGGLSEELGVTDYLTYYRLRHNFYSDSLTDQECVADWQCNGRYDGDGSASVCDARARRCTIPPADRPIRQVRYTLSAGYPRHLVRSAFQSVASWNVALMRGARAQRQHRYDARFDGNPPPLPESGGVPCQSDDPTAYCFCGERLAPEVDPTSRQCTPTIGTSNLFLRPAQRGELDPYRCWIEGPADIARPTSYEDYDADADGDGVADVYSYRFVGPECMLVLEVNACDRVPGAECQQLGDLRYQFFNYVSAAGAGWCGVMQPNQDPSTGEAIISPVNMGGICLDNISSQALTYWPMLRGEASSDPLFPGDDVRRYFEALGRVRQPVGLAPGARERDEAPRPRPARVSIDPSQILAHIERQIPDLELMRGPEGRRRLSHRLRNGEDTSIEHRYAAAIAPELFGALASTPRELEARARLSAPGVVTDELAQRASDTRVSGDVLDRVSPFRGGLLDNLLADRRREQTLEQTHTCMMFPDRAYQLVNQFGRYWAEAFRGRPATEARIRWAQAWHRAVMQHEMGHGMGLEHNFAATLDRDHYAPGYYSIEMADDCVGVDGTLRSCAIPAVSEFDGDGDNLLEGEDVERWQAELVNIRRQRQERGLGNYSSSSTMDYAGDLSDIFDIGFYDRAAIYYNYFGLTEAIVGEPRVNDPSSTRHDLLRSDLAQRQLWTSYRGGESCRQDADCPYAAGSSGLVTVGLDPDGAPIGQPVSQRCVTNVRFTVVPRPCTDMETSCVCSRFDDDLQGVSTQVPAPYIPARYLFCSNPRLNDISWCNAYDAGESFLEVVSNMRSAWEQSYPLQYFRRYRQPFTTGPRSMRWVIDAAKIYQHLFFRVNFEPGFRADGGPLGFLDQYGASIDAMNFMSYLAQLPDVGSYRMDPLTGVYEHVSDEPGMPGADFSLEPGQGFYTWSAYQDGLVGYHRIERAGTFFDKLLGLEALTTRDWGLSFTVDERYFINFYDLFDLEMTELFGGYILDEPSWYAPRVDLSGPEPVVEYINVYRGCADGACRPPVPDQFPGAPLGGTSNDVLRVYAAVFALAEFPIIYDTSWEQRLSVFALGNADAFEIPDQRFDGSPVCAYGTDPEDAVEPAHALCSSPVDADYIVYRSDRRRVSYVAVKVRPPGGAALEEEQLGFQLLLRMQTNQERVAELRALPALTPDQRDELDRRNDLLDRDESFLDTLIELQRIFGITSWF